MGVVYLGVEPDGRAVAIKVLRPHVAGDPDMRRRLAREVATLQRIRHPRVAQVLDADLESATPYLVTEYVPARQLNEVIREHGGFDATALVRLGRGLGDALAAIHDVGVIHRDLKPANVLVLDGDPVLIDFGIAHVVDDVRLTMTGLVMGTPGYLSPELIEGGQVGRATDWWAWAATMIFAATGRPPFGRGPMEVVLDRVRREAADLDGVPAGLVPVLRAALSVDPAARPRPGALRRALDEVACEPSSDDSNEWISGPVLASAAPTPAATVAVTGPTGAETEVVGAPTQVVVEHTEVVESRTEIVSAPTEVVAAARPIQPTRVIMAAPSTAVMPAGPPEPARPPVLNPPLSQPVLNPPLSQPVLNSPLSQPVLNPPLSQPVPNSPLSQPVPNSPLSQPVPEPTRPPWARAGQPRPYPTPPASQSPPPQQQRAPWAQPPTQAPWMNGPAGRPMGGPLPAHTGQQPPPMPVQPDAQHHLQQQPAQPNRAAPVPAPAQPLPRPRRNGTMLGCLVASIGAMVAFPIITLAVLALTSTLARTVNRTWWSVASRRIQRGRNA